MLPHLRVPFAFSLSFFLLLLLLPLTASTSSPLLPLSLPLPLPPPLPSLGIDISDVIPSFPSFNSNVDLAHSLSANTTSLSIDWSQIEPNTPKVYNDPNGILGTANGYYSQPDTWMQIALNIRFIDTVTVPWPPDLLSLSINDTIVVERYADMIVWTMSQLQNVTITQLAIANEIDVNQRAKQQHFWSEFCSFTSSVLSILRKRLSVVPLLGFTVTSHFACEDCEDSIELSKTLSSCLPSSTVDFLGVTIYGISSDFRPIVNDPSGYVVSLLSTMMNRITTPTPTPIFINELGYPTPNVSDAETDVDYEQLQSNFFTSALSFLSLHSASFPFLLFVRLFDLSESAAEAMAIEYGYAGNGNFTEYLRSLGVCTYEGRKKKAFDAIKNSNSNRDRTSRSK